MDILNETKYIMKKYNIKAAKALGQNFLIDENIIDKTIENADITKKDLVIEIGPGLGTLTSKLVEKAGKVICIELDEKMIQILQDRFALFNNIEIIQKDVLKVNINEIVEENKEYTVKVVANLPYYITTPIIMKLLEERYKIESITVMVQKEVAQRLCAKTGTREAGAITYTVEYYSKANKLFTVPNTSFIPMPNVESAVIKLDILKEQTRQVKNEEQLFKIIKYAFMQRRKTLLNALQNAEEFDKEKMKQILKELGINEKVRGEALTLEEFIQISNKI